MLKTVCTGYQWDKVIKITMKDTPCMISSIGETSCEIIGTYPIIFANVTLVTTNDQISSNNYRSIEMALMTPSVIDFFQILNYHNLEKK